MKGRGLEDSHDRLAGPAPVGRPAVMDPKIAVVVAEHRNDREVARMSGSDDLRLTPDDLDARTRLTRDLMVSNRGSNQDDANRATTLPSVCNLVCSTGARS